jgi:hypothetical protein
MENIEELLKCDCGSVFFDEIKAKTYIESKFIFHASTPNSKIDNEDVSIPVAKCLFCGKVYLPRTSFAGRNMLDRSVQVYAELSKQWVNSNYSLAANNTVSAIETKVDDVETKQDSTSDIKDAVPKSRNRGRSIKNNKE